MWPRLQPAQFDIEAGQILLPHYPFPTKRTRTIDRDACEHIVTWYPYALFLTDGDIVFLPRDQAQQVTQFAEATSLEFVDRTDVWSLLLDPFLDTEFSKEEQARSLATLKSCGLSADRVEDIRKRVDARMMRLTVLSWEWQYYGLYDVLGAMRPATPWPNRRWQAFYAEALQIARLG